MSVAITVTILTKNSEAFLSKVLKSTEIFDEVIIFDTGSIDSTLEIAARFKNVKIIKAEFEGFGKTHNLASSLATHDWILSVDSDEILSPKLVKEISCLNLQRGTVYSVSRKNIFKGRWIKGCGWWPDYQLRLYNRLDTRFNDDLVHESVIQGSLKNIWLNGSLTHYSYGYSTDLLAKMQTYTTLFAQQNILKKKSSLTKAILHGSFSFIKSYIIKCGFLDGSAGFEISLYNAITAYYKYIKLSEIQKNK